MEMKHILDKMHKIQDENGYVSEKMLTELSKELGISKGRLFEVLSFYDLFSSKQEGEIIIKVCTGTSCHAMHNKKILKEIEEALHIKIGETTKDGKFTLKAVDCLGECHNAPVAKVGETLHSRNFHKCEIINTKYENHLLKKAKTIEMYLETGGYEGLRKAISFSRKKDIIDEVKRSKLKGRSGSGFPVGLKWESAYNAPGRELNTKDKYVIANGDEGDPGCFVDKWIMENNPHLVIEGLAIAAYAVNANQGYIYIRDEYPDAIQIMETALKEAEKNGYIGNNMLGTGFNFKCRVMRGAGSYICGEESALMTYIEGGQGIPRIKPYFPAERGLYQQPTIVNNIETLANIPIVIKNGAEAFSKETNGLGTKIFSLSGAVANKGIVEIPLGKLTWRELIFDIGGGMDRNFEFKAIQVGGPLGFFLCESDLDIVIGFDEMREHNLFLGSGGVIVLRDECDIAMLTKNIVEFLAKESCGVCTPCREGLRSIVETYNRIANNIAEETDIELLKDISFLTQYASRCVLGKSICNPVLSSIEKFYEDYYNRIRRQDK